MLVLMWFLHHWYWWASLGVVYVVFLAATSILGAYVDFKNAPREPMEWCHKHGHFRKVHTLQLFPELGGTAANSNVCPTCYYEVVFKTPNQRLN